MQVYANSFRVEGVDAFNTVMRAIHGWLREKMELQFSMHEITHDNELSNPSSKLRPWLKSYVSVDEEPKLFAWRFKHLDNDVSGRQWIIELGLKAEKNFVDFSCSVQTEEQSTLVREPVNAKRPNVIAYVLSNISKASDVRVATDVPGLRIKHVGKQQEDYRALRLEIEREGRDYPLVLVSPTRTGNYLINSERLQEALFGLAQVIEVHTDFDSYDMTEELGKHWSAWDGAINILQTRRQNGHVFGWIWRSDEIEAITDVNSARVSFVLAKVTHNTNIPRLRTRVRPEGVAQLALMRRIKLRQVANSQDPKALKEENEVLWQELARLEESIQSAQKERDNAELARMQLEDEKLELEDKIRSLQYKSSALEQLSTSTISPNLDMDFLLKLASQVDQPTPEESLEAILKIFSNRCEILDTAWKSSREMSGFQYGRRLLDMLRRLMTDYYDAMRDGGDNRARLVFTAAEYSANESETVMNNATFREKRIFPRKGIQLEMFRHLRIGKEDNVSRTLRLHFAWIPEEDKIVIGHCGEHLPIANH